MNYRKKPIFIEAFRIPQNGVENADAGNKIVEWLEKNNCKYSIHPDATFFIKTLEGTMEGKSGDWIIRGVKGEFYPCKNDIFEATYEAV